MPDHNQVESRSKYSAISPHLYERGRRQWAAFEGRVIGWGGVTTVAAAGGMSDRTVRTGIRELDEIQAIESIVESSTRGDPMTSLRWTCKSTRVIAKELQAPGLPDKPHENFLAAAGLWLQLEGKSDNHRRCAASRSQFAV
jgi:hypothetical protein